MISQKRSEIRQGDRIRVLLVEDNPADVRLLREILSEYENIQFEITFTDRLSTAIEYLGRGNTDVILLDLSLPDSSGLDTVRETVAAAPHVPIVVLTDFRDETPAVEAVA